MDFVDNVIERATGTIRGRALFSNADSLFTPGMFGAHPLAGSAPYQALLVPDEAIGTEQARKYVLVVGLRQCRAAEIRHPRRRSRTVCASSSPGSTPTTGSSSTA